MPHHRNYGGARYKLAFVLVFHRIEQHFFRRFFGFILKIYAHIERDQRRVIVIDRIVDALHDAFFEKAFRNFHRRNTELFGKHFQRNFLRGDYCMIDLDGSNIRLFAFFGKRTFL